MKNEVSIEEKERIYKKLLEEYDLDGIDNVIVVGENSERLREKLTYIVKNNIL